MTTHGMTGTPEYQAYLNARSRCVYRRNKKYKFYGGRGIKFKFRSFEQFFKELGLRPSPQHSVDRIENKGHYAPGNVRWATKQQQLLNRRIPLTFERLVRTNIYLSQEQMKRLKAENEKTGAPIAELIRRAIDKAYPKK